MLITDNTVLRVMHRLSPIFGVMDLNKPREVSGNIALPKPVISSIDHFFFEEDQMIERSNIPS